MSKIDLYPNRNASPKDAQIDAMLGYSIAGVPDSLIIVIRTDAGNGSVYFAGTWKEIK